MIDFTQVDNIRHFFPTFSHNSEFLSGMNYAIVKTRFDIFGTNSLYGDARLWCDMKKDLH